MTYDVNFCLPVRELENDRVKLTPFIPSVHADVFFNGSYPHPELYTYMSFGPYTAVSDLLNEFIQGRIHRSPAETLFAIIDKTRIPPSASIKSDTSQVDLQKSLAGVVGFLNTSTTNLSTEIGFVMVLPPFQRTHVTTNAVGLLLHYALDLPTAGGLGLRRVQWQANSSNASSIRSAERLGFKTEALLKWDRVLPGVGKVGNGKEKRKGDPREDTLGRDTVLLALCWDEWEDGGRETVRKLMERRG